MSRNKKKRQGRQQGDKPQIVESLTTKIEARPNDKVGVKNSFPREKVDQISPPIQEEKMPEKNEGLSLPNVFHTGKITIRERMAIILECPKCKKHLDVTNFTIGTQIECPDCRNVTWVPACEPKWWYKGVNFVISVILSFSVGFGTSFAASLAYDKFYKEKEAKVTSSDKMEKKK